MARFPSDKPAKPIKEEARPETEVNRDDPNLGTSRNPLDSSIDWDFVPESLTLLGSNDESGEYDEEFERFDDEGMEMVQDDDCFNVISDWGSTDESKSTTEEDFLMNGASKPIGAVLSVKGKKVIVEGKGEHKSKVSKGSFLCIPETREPLGYVNEIFGTSEKPCYSVRVKSESEVLEWISEGTEVSLILGGCLQNDEKSCEIVDTSSGDDDTELSDDGDEEAAECRKMQKKMAKMEMSGQHKKKVLGLGKSKNQGTEETRRNMYSQQDFRNDQGLSIDLGGWPELSSNPFAPRVNSQIPQVRSQRLHHRGGGRGFRGRGQDQHPRGGGGRGFGGRGRDQQPHV